MLEIISRLFGKDSPSSKDIARERLRLVLVHDRTNVSPELLNLLKEDLIKVLQQYVDIDMDSLIVSIENEENSVALVANIPIKSMRRAANS